MPIIMRSALRDYLLALSPVVLTVGGCNMAYLAQGLLQCHYRPKYPKPCFLIGFDVTPLIEFGKWGLLFLLPIAVLLSIGLCVRTFLNRRWYKYLEQIGQNVDDLSGLK